MDVTRPLVETARSAGENTRRAGALIAESIAVDRWADAAVAIFIDLGLYGVGLRALEPRAGDVSNCRDTPPTYIVRALHIEQVVQRFTCSLWSS